MKAIIITGNAVEGFEFYGPFETELEAIEWANQDAHLDETWCVGKVHSPLVALSFRVRRDRRPNEKEEE